MQDRRYHPQDAPQASPELELMLACARWPQMEQQDTAHIRTLSAGAIDWPHFLVLVQHHRLVPLVSLHLHAAVQDSASPALQDALAELRQLSEWSAHQSLRCLAELRRVTKALQSHTIPVRVLKGLPLAQSTFGDLSLRAPGDLDLLIDESRILEADSVLRGFGYRGLFQIDRFSPRRLAFYRSHWKDLAYANPDTGFEVDLHWRCFRNSQMPGAGLCSTGAHDTVSFASFQVDTLPRLQGLLYLCVHGTLDGWLYFKSLVDVSAQVSTMDQAELDAVATLADTYAILPELTATLLLVRRYLGMDHWSELLLPESDRTVQHILRYSNQTLAQSSYLAGREAIPIATTLAFEFGLRRNLRYRGELLLRILYRARMWETIPLPDSLFAIYPLLSPFEWIIYRLRHAPAKPGPNVTLAI